MRIRTLEITVGVFMLIGLLALVFLALRVSGLSLSQQAGDTYVVSARFENIGGLTQRAKVTMSGVEIGRVRDIYFDPEQFNAVVEMEVHGKFDNLSTDTSAAILTAGLLGEQYVGLTVGADEEVLEDGDEIDDTQSALVLEELIGKFLFNQVND